ncbi:hypothetical protein GGTG_00529 [Gaeumannomyces tritici R3-111a-1]|uniref:Ecp2 effector protein domain-containing protein n=1 Tax=Gaeumannomyces tritici (strain R3-111a-1) TaxID=644352 RepID=J3NGZ3_GAET3|nr:hypothetical protein GGTG_00529 [Gaeumannomyces tritici R3-111a-1]EJT80533.1 hypothetical protein GGTG_00529 [Gaeumannomyces tritici R3-111a-1]
MRTNTIFACLGAVGLAAAAAEPTGTRDMGRSPFVNTARMQKAGDEYECAVYSDPRWTFSLRDAQAVIQKWADRGDVPILLAKGDCFNQKAGKCLGWICRTYASNDPAVTIPNSLVVSQLKHLSNWCFGQDKNDSAILRHATVLRREEVETLIISIGPTFEKS